MLDNFEHVIEAAAVVSDLLQASRHLKIVVTSREKLHLYGEHEYIVLPLMLPEVGYEYAIEDLIQIPAIALFIDRAQNVKPAFSLTSDSAPIIVEICRKLDGLPLAIELAAAQSKHLSPNKILERLSNRFEVLTHGPRDLPSRQQTLRAAIDWSYDLLDDQGQMLFRRLGVFIGGCTLEGVEAVCSEPHLLSTNLFDRLIFLVDKSMVHEIEIGEELRFTMLETIREYAVEKLHEHAEYERVRTHHAAYYVRFAEQAEQEYRNSQQVLWINRVEQEHDNIRAAIEWTLKHELGSFAVRLCGALWRFWLIRGYLSEGRQWLKQALENSAECPDVIRVKAVDGSGVLAMFQGDYTTAVSYYQEALTLFRQLEDRIGISDILESLGVLHIFLGNHAQAMQLHRESLVIRRTLRDIQKISSSLTNLGYIALTQADYEQAQKYIEESLAISRSGSDIQGIAISLCNLGLISLKHYRNYHRAYLFYKESLEVVQEMQDKEVIMTSLEGLALVAIELQELDRAARIFSAINKLRATFGLAPNSSSIRGSFEQTMLRTRKRLGEDVWALRAKEGRAMTTEELITHALQIKTLPETFQLS